MRKKTSNIRKKRQISEKISQKMTRQESISTTITEICHRIMFLDLRLADRKSSLDKKFKRNIAFSARNLRLRTVSGRIHDKPESFTYESGVGVAGQLEEAAISSPTNNSLKLHHIHGRHGRLVGVVTELAGLLRLALLLLLLRRNRNDFLQVSGYLITLRLGLRFIPLTTRFS